MTDHALYAPDKVPSATRSTADTAPDTRPTPRGLERTTTPLVGGVISAIAIASAIAFPALARPDNSADLALFLVNTGALLSALFALQLQAAILVLRDQRYAVATIGAGVCTMAATVLVLGFTHEETTPALTVAIVGTTPYVARLRRQRPES